MTRTLVLGSTGTVGRQVVRALHALGVPVRAAARDPGSAGHPAGVEVARVDLTEPATLDAALADVSAAFLIWPFRTTEAAAEPVELLGRRAGRVVYLSSTGRPDPSGALTEPIPFHAEMEKLVAAAAAEWTFLRPGGFAANTLMWADQIRAGDTVSWPYAQAARSLIHEADIAAVAARALSEPGHAGRVHLLSGPRALTQAEQVRQIGAAIGRPLRFAELDRDAARALLLDAWGDPDFVESALATWAGFVTRPELVTDTVERVTGHRPHTYGEWARDHAADFR